MRKPKRTENLAAYYDRGGVLEHIEDIPVAFALNEQLRAQILHGKRGHRLQNVSIKLDAVQVQALRKLATLRSIPYQTLIRQLLADGLRRELRLAG